MLGGEATICAGQTSIFWPFNLHVGWRYFYIFLQLYHGTASLKQVYYFWLVLWNFFYFSIYWESSSQLTNIFQGNWNHQTDLMVKTPSLPLFFFVEPGRCDSVSSAWHLAGAKIRCSAQGSIAAEDRDPKEIPKIMAMSIRNWPWNPWILGCFWDMCGGIDQGNWGKKNQSWRCPFGNFHGFLSSGAKPGLIFMRDESTH